MRLSFHTFRAALATGISLWMAALACLMGCTLPNLANSGSIQSSSIHLNAADQTQPDAMANMENCPHHSGGNIPAKPNGSKPSRGGAMSCCPLEVTVNSKPIPATLQIAPAPDFVLASNQNLAIIRFHSVEFVSPVCHSGRDTLLETNLLRI
jgi:hypothetical protein